MVTSNRYPLHAALTGKGILGPSIGESNQKVGDLSGGSVSAHFAASNGVIVEGGKFKCPPGTVGAGDFTDALGSTCGTPSGSGGSKGIAPHVGMMAGGRMMRRGAGRGGGVGAAIRRVAPDPNAIDADGDGIVQEGTSAARRAVKKVDSKKYGGWNIHHLGGRQKGDKDWDKLYEETSKLSSREIRKSIDRIYRRGGPRGSTERVRVYKAVIDEREAAKEAQNAARKSKFRRVRRPTVGDNGTVGQMAGKEFDGDFSEKVGLAGSHSKPLQAIQAGASLVTPGDMSDVRSPVRSTLWEIITPGGGKDRDRLRRPKIGRGQDRCPPGFEFGGRFTNTRLSTCGTRLFDLPSLRGAASEALQVARGPKADDTLKGREVRGTITPNVTNTRKPEIPPVGALNIGEINTSVSNNIPLVATDSSNSARLVRRDGSVLSSMVSAEKLASTRNNADMADGVIIRRATDPNKIGEVEIGLLAAGARSAVMVFPDGSHLTLSRTSKATPEAIRGMSRRWAAIRRNQPDLGYGAALEKFVSESDGKLELKPEIKNVKGPLQMIEVTREDGSRRMVRRWIFEIFLAANAPSRPASVEPWTAVPAGKALPYDKKKA